MSANNATINIASSSGESFCAHIYDPVSQRFLSDDCPSCLFANKLRSQRRSYPGLKKLDWDLKKVCQSHSIDLDTFASRLSNFVVGRHASLAAYQRFSVSMFDNLPHLHGSVNQDVGTHSCGANYELPGSDLHSDRCFDSAAGCNSQLSRLSTRMVNSTSEGSGTTSWSVFCSHCRAAIWQAGLGGQIMLLDLAHNFMIDFNEKERIWWMGPKDRSYATRISEVQANKLSMLLPFMFTPRSFDLLATMPYHPEERMRKKLNLPSKMKSTDICEFFGKDLVGNLVCRVGIFHKWNIHIPCLSLTIPVSGPMRIGFDHMLWPTGIVSSSKKSVRATNMWGISGYHPRINEEMLWSLQRRFKANKELEAHLGLNDSDDEYCDAPDCPVTLKGERSEAHAFDLEGRVLTWDEGNAAYYKVDEDGFIEYVSDADVVPSGSERESDTEGVHVEYHQIPSEVQEYDDTYPEGEILGTESYGPPTGDGPHVRLLSTSIGESVGGMIVSHANYTEYLHNLIEGPCAALNDSIRDFGTWLMGQEVKARLRPSDFPDWVDKKFEPLVKRIVGQLESFGSNLQSMMAEDQRLAADFGKDLLLLKKAVEQIVKDLRVAGENFNSLNVLISSSSGLKDQSVIARLEQIERKIEEILTQSAESEKALHDRMDEIEGKVERQLDLAVKDLARKSTRKMVELEGRIRALEKGKVLSEDEAEVPVVVERPRRRPSLTTAGNVGSFPGSRSQAQMAGPEGSNVEIAATENAPGKSEAPAGVSKLPYEDDTPTILSGEYLIDQFEWKTDQATTSVIHTIHLPSALMKTTDWLKEQSKLFQYMKLAGCEITVAWTSNAMQGGVLAACWDSMSVGSRRNISDLHSYSHCDSLIIQAGVSSKAEFYVQFDTVQGKLSLSGFELGLLSLGTLTFIPMCPLVVPANTTQSVSVNVFCRLLKGEFLVRTIPHKYSEYFQIGDDTEAQGSKEFYVKRIASGVVSKTRSVGLRQVTVKKVKRQEGGLKRVVVSQAGSLDSSIGFAGGHIKSSDVCPTDIVRGVTSENVIHTGKWKGSDRGLLVALNVHPCYNKVVSSVMVPTSLSMVSSLFHYWRGSLIYRIYLGCNVFTTGKLHAVALPARMIVENPSDVRQLVGLGGVVFDMDQRNVFYELEVPFYGIGSWQRTQRFSLFDAMFYGEDLVTRLFISVVNPLITNVGATDSVNYCITVQAGNNFELKVQNGLIDGAPSMVKMQGFEMGTKHAIAARLEGSGFGSLLPTWGHFGKFKIAGSKGVSWKVAPLLRQFTVANNPLSFLSSMFVRWNGSMKYKMMVSPHKKNEVKMLYVWMMVEDPEQKKEFAKHPVSIPPTGSDFMIWDLSRSSIFEITVPFISRFESLCIPHEDLADIEHHQTFYYSGAVYIGNPTEKEVEISAWVGPGSDMKLFSRGPLCSVGATSGDFGLKYIDKLKSIEKVPESQKNSLLGAMKAFIEAPSTVGTASASTQTDPGETYNFRPQRPGRKSQGQCFDYGKPSEIRKNWFGAIAKVIAKARKEKAPERKSLNIGASERRLLRQKAIPDLNVVWEKKEEMPTCFRQNRPPSERQAFGLVDKAFDSMRSKAAGIAVEKVTGCKTKNTRSIDVGQFAEGVSSLGVLAKELDIDGLNVLISQAGPMLSCLKAEQGKYQAMAGGLSEGIANFNSMAECGRKCLRILESCYTSSSIAWIVGKTDDGNLTVVIAASLAILVVGGFLWRKLGKTTWIERLAVGVAIIWLPLLGLRALELMDFLKSLFKKSTESADEHREDEYPRVPPPSEAQGIADWILELLGWSDAILGAIFAMGCLLVLGVLPDERKMKSWTDSFHGLGKKASSLNSISRLFTECGSWAKTISEKLINWIMRMRGERLLENDEKLNVVLKCNVGQWVKRVNELSLEENKWADVSGEEKIAEIRGLFDQGQIIQQQMLKHVVVPQVTSVVRDTVSKVGKLINETYCARGLGAPRVDPIHIAFIGAPGCGKSAMTTKFINDLLDFMKEPRKDRLYSRACADQYWSRYYGQPAVLYDDLGAIAGDPSFSDYGEFIQLKTNTPYSLNMASVEEKGTMFRSKYLFSTSNNFFLDGQTNLRTPDAFYRRRDLAVHVARDPNVPFCSEDPTRGMTFTVLDTFTRQVKRTWPHFVPVEMREMVIVNQPYRVFLAFVVKFTKAWFAVQDALVKQMKESVEESVADDIESLLSRHILNDEGPELELDMEHLEEEIELFEQMQRTYAEAVEEGPRPSRGKNKRQPTHFLGEKPSTSGSMVYLGRVRSERQGISLDRIFTRDELVNLFDSFSFTGVNILASLEQEVGFCLEEFKVDALPDRFEDLVTFLCDCEGRKRKECSAAKMFDLLNTRNFMVRSGPASYDPWIVRGRNADGTYWYRLKAYDVSAGRLFLGMLQAFKQQLKEEECPGALFYETKPKRAIFNEHAVQVYDKLGSLIHRDMEGNEEEVLWFKTNVFAEAVLPAYGLNGIPLSVCGKKVWIGDEVPSKPFPWDNSATIYLSILARSDIGERLDYLLATLGQVDRIVLRQAVRVFDGKLMSLVEGDEEKWSAMGLYDLGRENVAWVVMCLSLISRSNYLRSRTARLKEAKITKEECARAIKECDEAVNLTVREASPWHTNLLKYAGITAAVLAGGAVIYGVVKIFGGLFGSEAETETAAPEQKESLSLVRKVDVLAEAAKGWTPVTGEDMLKETSVVPNVVQMQASSVCSSASKESGDETTKKQKKEGKYQRGKVRGRFGQGWRSENQFIDCGFSYDEVNGHLEGEVMLGVAQFHACVARALGIEVQVPEVLEIVIGTQSPICDIVAHWHNKLTSSGAVMECPLDLQEVKYVEEDDKTITAVIGNTPIVISKDMKHGVQREMRILGRHISREEERIRGCPEELVEGIDEVLGFRGQEKPLPVIRGETVRKVIGHSGGISYADEAINQIWPKMRNACQVLVNKTRGVKMFCLAIVGSWILVPAHFTEALTDGDSIVLVGPRRCTEMEYHSDRAFLVSQYQDLMLIDLGPRCPQAPDVTKFFISEVGLAHYKACPGYMAYVTHGKKSREMWQILPVVDRITINVEQPTTFYSTAAGDHLFVSGWRYPGFFGKGFCGTPIFSSAGELGSCRVVGMHTAGNLDLKIGYAEVLTRESIMAVIESQGFYKGKAEAQAAVEALCSPPGRRMLPRPMEMPELGVLNPSYNVRVSSQTEIKKSPIFGLFKQIETEPSILSSADPRLREKRFAWDPLQEAVEKYGECTRPFRRDDIRQVEKALIKYFRNFENEERRRDILSQDEAINGLEGSSTFLPIRMDTSPGWPWIKERPKNSKGKWFLFEEIEPFPTTGGKKFAIKSAELQRSMDEAEVNARQSILTFPLSVENAKDERRKLKKIYEAPSTRAFTTLECGTNLLYRKYFLSFAAAVMSNFRRGFCKVGMNPYSLDWSEMILGMLKRSPRGFAGDYAKFDGIGDPEMYMSICEVINQWYDDGPENAQVRRSMFMGVFHRHTLVRNTVVEVDQGLPSGFSMTVIVNSMINIYYLGIAWMNLMENSPFYPYARVERFLEECYVATYGDDNVVAVPESFLEWYNLKTVASFLARYGVVYTDDQKRPLSESEPHVDILSCTFLKRSFRKFGAGMLFVAPLDKVSIEEQCNWVRGIDGEKALAQNVNNAMYEASLHGKVYFNEFEKRLKNAYFLVGMEYTGPCWVECQARTWEELTGDALESVDVDNLAEHDALSEELIDEKCIRVNGKIVSPDELLDLCRNIPGQVVRAQFVNGLGTLVKGPAKTALTLNKYKVPVGHGLKTPLVVGQTPLLSDRYSDPP